MNSNLFKNKVTCKLFTYKSSYIYIYIYIFIQVCIFRQQVIIKASFVKDVGILFIIIIFFFQDSLLFFLCQYIYI